MFLERKKNEKKEKLINYITDDIGISSDSSYIFFWQRMFWWRKFKKNTHIVKLFLKANKKTVKIFVYDFFLYIKMLTGYYKKEKKKLSKKLVKGTKIFLKKEKTKSQYAPERYRNLSEEEKENKHQYRHDRFKNLLEN